MIKKNLFQFTELIFKYVDYLFIKIACNSDEEIMILSMIIYCVI